MAFMIEMHQKNGQFLINKEAQLSMTLWEKKGFPLHFNRLKTFQSFTGFILKKKREENRINEIHLHLSVILRCEIQKRKEKRKLENF